MLPTELEQELIELELGSKLKIIAGGSVGSGGGGRHMLGGGKGQWCTPLLFELIELELKIALELIEIELAMELIKLELQLDGLELELIDLELELIELRELWLSSGDSGMPSAIAARLSNTSAKWPWNLGSAASIQVVWINLFCSFLKMVSWPAVTVELAGE
jgi:hypothetical protein